MDDGVHHIPAILYQSLIFLPFLFQLLHCPCTTVRIADVQEESNQQQCHSPHKRGVSYITGLGL